MKRSLLEKNKDLIISLLMQKEVFRHDELHKFVAKLKEEGLIPRTKTFTTVYDFFIEAGLVVHLLEINGTVIERYSMYKEVDVYQLANSIRSRSFFSMTTALNLQGLIDERKNYIFVSYELTPKDIYTEPLTQSAIDAAYKKPYRITKNYGEFKDNFIILLSPKNTNQFGVISHNGCRMSSINRAFVEMIVNIQYFQNSVNVIQLFKPLKLKLDVNSIYSIIEKFDFIYPYYQLFGFLLENIGFDKDVLQKYKAKVTPLKFYTDKNQNAYKFDSYWNIYYTK